ncbi:MlaD family protein [Paucidesulfovibrio longus]|uniref:MlaD family protein n=1 Tax=Paucidesulfovibrio longus TaxID=889 RepID=UPI0003B3B7AB|nr:MlaD family protein [Paucidesulfovibrio longus]
MSRQRYHRLGLFIIGGTALLLFVVFALGAGRFLNSSIKLETYFNESVNGLEVGSPVKYRGVKIGTVSHIGFVMGRYTSVAESDYRYVLVECELSDDSFLNRPEAEIADQIQEDVKRGLRIRPTSVGITGQLFLGIDYLDPASNPPLPITWEPRNLYIPSAPSTLSRLEEAVTRMSEAVGGIDREDVEGILKGVRKVTDSLGSFLEKADAKTLGELLAANLEQTEGIFASVNRLLRDPEAVKLLPNASLVMGDLHGILGRAGEDIVATAADMRVTFAALKTASIQLEQALRQPGTDLPTLAKRVDEATGEAAAASAKLHELLNRINGVVAGQQGNVQEILEGLRLLVQDLREITQEARRYPSGMLFGEPPARELPEGHQRAAERPGSAGDKQ